MKSIQRELQSVLRHRQLGQLFVRAVYHSRLSMRFRSAFISHNQRLARVQTMACTCPRLMKMKHIPKATCHRLHYIEEASR